MITWGGIGSSRCSHKDASDGYEGRPAGARRTLEEHAGDPRPHVYTRDELEQARTHDRSAAGHIGTDL